MAEPTGEKPVEGVDPGVKPAGGTPPEVVDAAALTKRAEEAEQESERLRKAQEQWLAEKQGYEQRLTAGAAQPSPTATDPRLAALSDLRARAMEGEAAAVVQYNEQLAILQAQERQEAEQRIGAELAYTRAIGGVPLEQRAAVEAALKAARERGENWSVATAQMVVAAQAKPQPKAQPEPHLVATAVTPVTASQVKDRYTVEEAVNLSDEEFKKLYERRKKGEEAITG